MARPAQSKSELQLYGTYREDRHGKGDLPPEKPSCPSWLSKEAKAEWKRIVPTLVGKVNAHKIDRALLAAYCQTWADYHRAVTELAKIGDTYESTTESGGVIWRLHPLVQVRNTARQDLVRMGSKLGLSPSARTGMDIGDPSDDKKPIASRRGA